MAEEAKESQENEAPAPAEARSKGSWLKLVLVAVVALALGAGGSYFLLSRKAGAAPQPAEEAAANGGEEQPRAQPADPEAGDPSAPPASLTERLVSLEPFVVNLGGENYPRYLKLKLDLELADAGGKTELEERMPQIRDALIVLLTSKRAADLSDFEGKALLKEEILDRVNGLLEKAQVSSVLFTEFVIQ